jgi:hypothetical protein
LVRVWDLPPSGFCVKHLLGEHREVHALWTILTENKKGYRKHPETIRWEGKLLALYKRHEDLVSEMNSRGYVHASPLDYKLAIGDGKQDNFVNSIDEQKALLKRKRCSCHF